jgi:hypothetical protein
VHQEGRSVYIVPVRHAIDQAKRSCTAVLNRKSPRPSPNDSSSTGKRPIAGVRQRRYCGICNLQNPKARRPGIWSSARRNLACSACMLSVDGASVRSKTKMVEKLIDVQQIAFAALWKCSICRIQLVSGFHLGQIWATNLRSGSGEGCPP